MPSSLRAFVPCIVLSVLLGGAGPVQRLTGARLATGPSPAASAESFRATRARALGAEPADLVADEPREVPVMWQPQSGTYKFTVVFYRQERDGVPVFGSALKLLARNVTGYPIVLASADLRELGAFRVREPAAPAGPGPALARAAVLSPEPGAPRAVSARRVIWAGTARVPRPPRLADESVVAVGADAWLILTDAATGAVVHEERLVHTFAPPRAADGAAVTGTATGLATEGPGRDTCEPEVPTPLPYLLVSAGASSAYADAGGAFAVGLHGFGGAAASAGLAGRWFEVETFLGTPAVESATGPGPIELLFNSANDEEFVRAQVNGYVHANRIRDWVLGFNPAYPGLDAGGFRVVVNRADLLCPGNAWYSAGEQSINFCRSRTVLPNMAFSSVIYHEFTHHLVQAAGSGQGAYGEGMSDSLSILLLDDPLIAQGYHGNCFTALRSAINDCLWDPLLCSTCGASFHDCGLALAGSVWRTREALGETHPDDAIDILADLAISSIVVHTGPDIGPELAIDFLTLDDDDADICNGTPHRDEIAAGFGLHAMLPEPVAFAFPEGLPELIEPGRAALVPVAVSCTTSSPVPGTGLLHLPSGSGFASIPMTPVGEGLYDALLPALPCGGVTSWFVSVQTSAGETVTWPPQAPAGAPSAIGATSADTVFADDFETDTGWTVTNLLDLDAGAWQRGVPSGAGDRGDPLHDADGSGQCFLTGRFGGDDVDGWATILMSPLLDASAPGTLVRYWRWFSNDAGGITFQDSLVVEVSADGGLSWTLLEEVGPTGVEATGGWYSRTFRVADFVEPTAALRIRFAAADFDEPSIVEAAIDGVELLVIGCAAGDVDADGVVGAGDLLALLAAWGPCPRPCAADLDADGAVGAADLALLLTSF